jgi:peptidyl-tRNA hydrolase
VRIKAIYRKNLKMSEGKVASQVAHAVKNIGLTPLDCDIIVLGVSDKKCTELSEFFCIERASLRGFIQRDKGLTQVEAGTPTAAAWIDSV